MPLQKDPNTITIPYLSLLPYIIPSKITVNNFLVPSVSTKLRLISYPTLILVILMNEKNILFMTGTILGTPFAYPYP